MNTAEGQLSTANNNLDQKNADLQKAKEAVNNANSKVASQVATIHPLKASWTKHNLMLTLPTAITKML